MGGGELSGKSNGGFLHGDGRISVYCRAVWSWSWLPILRSFSPSPRPSPSEGERDAGPPPRATRDVGLPGRGRAAPSCMLLPAGEGRGENSPKLFSRCEPLDLVAAPVKARLIFPLPNRPRKQASASQRRLRGSGGRENGHDRPTRLQKTEMHARRCPVGPARWRSQALHRRADPSPRERRSPGRGRGK